MILDHVCYHANLLKPFLNKNKIELVLFPAYSPYFNPIRKGLVAYDKNKQ